MNSIKTEIIVVDIPDLYTKTAYARKINKSATWVNELIKQGKLREVKIHGTRLVKELAA